MSNKNPFNIDQTIPCAIFKTKVIEDGVIDLYFEEVSEALLTMLHRSGSEALLGKALSSFDDRPGLFEEWNEFILRVRYMPYVDVPFFEDNNFIWCDMLQFSDISNTWLIAHVRCYKNGPYAMVSFLKLHEASLQVEYAQLLTFTSEKSPASKAVR